MTLEAKITRYSDAELTEFKARIERKLGYAREDYEFVSNQITDQTETMESDGDWMDSSSANNDLELLYIMANRQRKHIEDLEKALIRIKNKTYGICKISGDLIDKRRLFAVPTTSKSLAAKLDETAPKKATDEEEKMPKKKPTIKKEPVIISRIVRKPSAAPAIKEEELFEEEEEMDNDEDFDVDVPLDEAFDVIDPDSLESDNEQE